MKKLQQHTEGINIADCDALRHRPKALSHLNGNTMLTGNIKCISTNKNKTKVDSVVQNRIKTT